MNNQPTVTNPVRFQTGTSQGPLLTSTNSTSATGPRSISVSILPSGTTLSSPIWTNIVTSPVISPVISPVKIQTLPGTPSSPRPIILIRKRLGSEQQATSTTNSVTDTTPTKKPRKQLLEPFHLTTSNNIKPLLNDQDNVNIKEETTGTSVHIISGTSSNINISTSNSNNVNKDAAPGGVITISKKPRISINSYNVPWKSCQYHFLRYTDVKQKSEKKTTLSELSNEGLQRKNGWKVQHLVTHMEDADEEETQLYSRLRSFSNFFDTSDQDIHKTINMLGRSFYNSQRTFIDTQVQLFDKLTDLIRGNLQRSKLFQDQINEGKNLLIKLTNDHKERVGRLTKKCVNKRTLINK
ncbi:histone deacetylase complex subunit SAP130-like [Panonychus citri]|uniref:histone deacetylase complex subunit SAP130-like n=1 Tax=Panonychus citri TaxID=50023 RepID=UPI0023077B58|nr:histone deacetylase complex subunit SAP130-like [Panonychus citri]